MEMGQPPAPAMRTPTAKATPMVRVCSERHCRTIITGPFRGNMCDQCIAAMRARSFSHEKVATPGNIPAHNTTQERQSLRRMGAEFIRKEMPTSVRARFHMPMDWVSKPFSQVNNMQPYLSVSHRNERVRPQLPAETPQLRTRPVEYFNSRGELALNGFPSPSNPSSSGYASCREANVVPVGPSIENGQTQQATANANGSRDITHIILDVTKVKPDAEDDADLDDLELKYPEDPEIKPPIPLWTLETKGKPEHLPTTEEPPTKRQKLSHPVIDLADTTSTTLSHPSNVQTTSPVPKPKVVKSSKNPARSLKLCTTSNCTGIVSSGSFASRCLSCVRRDWKAKREGSKQTPPVLQNASGSNQGSSSTSGASLISTKLKKKGVSWADEIEEHRSGHSPSSEPGIIGSTLNEQVVTSKAGESFTLGNAQLKSGSPDIADYLNLDGLVEMEAGSLETTTTITTITVLSEESSEMSHTHRNDPSGSSECKQEKLTSGDPEQISGWDSDLSDLTESPERDSESESSSEKEYKLSRPSAPSGFKIRIPPRPMGAYTVKCSSQRCKQLLPTGSRWKSCVLCRARSRDYQRRKQNLQRVDLRLEDELMDSQSMGTPLAAGLATETPAYKDAIRLVPGARLCAIRTCTFIIPPVSEYRWKMCSLCRIRWRERRKQEIVEANSSPSSSSRRKPVVGDANFMLRSLDFLTRTESVGASSRCRSLDCGMANSSSRDCSQCSARRLWLVNRSPSIDSHPEGPKLLHRGSKKPMERPAPYQRYKCFTAVLLDFKSRLSGFLQVQSVFFLFNQPRSANALFAFDGEFSVVALDFDIMKRKEEMDANALKLKREIEYVGRIKFSPKRLVSELEGGGISIRYSCFYPVPILQPRQNDGQTSINTLAKNMQCELEIAVLPDHSHRFIPGQRTIIRFRLFG